MDVAIVTVGDEILAGDTENTNAAWLARRLNERGVTVTRMLTIPDDPALITEAVREWAAQFDAVVVGGGLGGTHDDITMDAVAAAFDRELVVEEAVRRDVVQSVADYRGVDPEKLDPKQLDLDVAAWAAIPEGSRPLLNPVGLSPGCVLENVYVFPGPPAEYTGMFETVAEEFGGDVVSDQLYTPSPEASLLPVLAEFRERFDLVVGSYPSRDGPNRLKVTGTDEDAVAEALDWLRERVETVDDVVEPRDTDAAAE